MAPSGASSVGPPLLPSSTSATSATERDRLTVLCALLTSDTGWLRVVPSEGGKTVYCKWKWTSGRLCNRYVMTVGPVEDVFDLLELLGRKREDAEQGIGPSSLDRYYNGS